MGSVAKIGFLQKVTSKNGGKQQFRKVKDACSLIFATVTGSIKPGTEITDSGGGNIHDQERHAKID